MFQITSINAFSRGAPTGNPAGVCLLQQFPDAATMQDIATRVGHAETAFLVAQSTNHYALRWFTPTTEVSMCGHGSVAAAHFLRESCRVDTTQPIKFSITSGELEARYDGIHIYLTLPATPGEAVAITPTITACIDAPIERCLRSKSSYLVTVADMHSLHTCKPNLQAIAALDSEDLIVTTAGQNGYDYAYRCFCPQVGIDEDQVTGSANAILAPYWSQKLARTHMQAFQASRNGGALMIQLMGNAVEIGGEAHTISTISMDINQTEAA